MIRADHIKSIAEEFDGDIAREYTWVHDWLDEFAVKGISLRKHRQYRHHEEALKDLEKFARKKHPRSDIEIVLKVARQHIRDDMGHVPENEVEFIC